MSLKDAGVTLIDCDHKTPKAQESGFPYVGIPQLKDGRIILDGVRLISEEDFHHWRRKAKPQTHDVILSRRCNPGESAYVPEGLEIALGQNLVLLRSDAEKIYPPFLRWLTQGPEWWGQVGRYLNVGAVFDSLKCADIPNFELSIPPLNQQINISKFLSDLDYKIQLNRQINQTLEQMAQAIFQSWFVDFEPVKAKIAAREDWLARRHAQENQKGQQQNAQQAAQSADDDAPQYSSPACYAHEFAPAASTVADQPDLITAMNRAAMCAISGKTDADLDAMPAADYQRLYHTASLFPDELIETELGEIPKGWEVSSIYEISDVIYGAPFKSKLFNQECNGIPLIRIRDLKDERPGVYTPEQHPKGYLVNNGDLLVGMDGEFRPYVWGGGEAWLNQRVCCFKPKSGYSQGMVKGFIEPLLMAYERTATATTVIHLGKGDIDNFKICMAGDSLLKTFSSAISPVYEMIVKNKTESRNLAVLRDSLLPKLLSGELDISALTDLAAATDAATGAANV